MVFSTHRTVQVLCQPYFFWRRPGAYFAVATRTEGQRHLAIDCLRQAGAYDKIAQKQDSDPLFAHRVQFCSAMRKNWAIPLGFDLAIALETLAMWGKLQRFPATERFAKPTQDIHGNGYELGRTCRSMPPRESHR
jgi:hypothetical protein